MPQAPSPASQQQQNMQLRLRSPFFLCLEVAMTRDGTMGVLVWLLLVLMVSSASSVMSSSSDKDEDVPSPIRAGAAGPSVSKRCNLTLQEKMQIIDWHIAQPVKQRSYTKVRAHCRHQQLPTTTNALYCADMESLRG
jgi:hypothetical protein